MPDRNADPNVHPNDGPAIKMDPKDHNLTSSNGRNGRAGRIYRKETADMIKNGKHREENEENGVRLELKKTGSDSN